MLAIAMAMMMGAGDGGVFPLTSVVVSVFVVVVTK